MAAYSVFIACALLLICQLHPAAAAPPLATDVFISPCPTISDPPPGGFLLWSAASSWANGVIPGVGAAAGANVTIPCNVSVLLDVGNLVLNRLVIQGFLKFGDASSIGDISIQAHFIIVEGQLQIGTAVSPFRHQVTIELTPNVEGNRAQYVWSSFAPADPLNPRYLGHKAFAIVGGQVDIHGLAKGADTPTWVKLIKTANVGDTSIYVDTDVSAQWPVGSFIVVASTDYDRGQAEEFNITSVVSIGAGRSFITLSGAMRYMHYGSPNTLTDGFGGFLDQQAEVVLVSRNIVIMGTDEPSPYQLEGGHFINFQTRRDQYIEGVQFYKMGQQGTIGRYSLHMHLVGNAPGIVLRKNSIYMSKQRCIVIHATHNVTIDSNVAYNTKGHCFMVEDGGEMNNTFINNIGLLQEPVTQLISLAESDNQPSTFWISAPYNHYINNVAAGAGDSGFWFELLNKVRGISYTIPSMIPLVPYYTPLGTFSGNVAHSNRNVGIRTYPHGLRPRVNWKKSRTIAVYAVWSNLNVYKHFQMGVLVQQSDSIIIANSTFADNNYGINFHFSEDIRVVGSRFVGYSDNYGNPQNCDIPTRTSYALCRPLDNGGCTLPLPAGAQGRSVYAGTWNAPIFGVIIFQSRDIDENNLPHRIQTSSFYAYNPTCHIAAAIAMVGQSDFWNPSHSVNGLRLSPDTQPVWSAPKRYIANPFASVSNGGEIAQFYTLFDRDGCIMGSPGYIVANNSNILPPTLNAAPSQCTFNTTWNAYKCPSACYRTVGVTYMEPNFPAQNSKFTHGMFSWLQVTRVSDNKVFILDGNLDKVYGYGYPPFPRTFYFTVVASQTYTVQVMAPADNPTFTPVDIKINFEDPGECGQGLTLNLLPPPDRTKAWTLQTSDHVSYVKCKGSLFLSRYAPDVAASVVCFNRVTVVKLAMQPTFASTIVLTSGTGATNICSQKNATYQCSILWSGSSGWKYDAKGDNPRPAFYNPGWKPIGGWLTGRAPFGYYRNTAAWITTMLPAPSQKVMTYYYRHKLTIYNTKCFKSLHIDVMVNDGLVLYLNNKEIIRVNMPTDSNINNTLNTTLAVTQSPLFPNWQTFVLPVDPSGSPFSLSEGNNVFAAEQHVFASYEWYQAFDMRMYGVRTANCKGAMVTPEVCDGLDNNHNGKIDERLNKRKFYPLLQTCSTKCGTGYATCINGQYQKCTAPTTC
eukprot:TRINITY_DN7575_c0_g1_i1.p1 TRINITY_DN7575_c0_g1~~TRINITY_DN7575_c0_g1_i1.p1  ORF type:complete len:1194 (-),score=130.61 TRINITY_DN7575_c0_g1_i1:1675-5256(-)